MADPDAAAILQDFLDAVSETIMLDDWDGFRDAVSLPLHIISHDESKVVTTEAELKLIFDQFRNTLRFQKVTDYIRLVDSATLLDRFLISGNYITHLLARGHRILVPFRSQMTLRLQANRWRVASVTNGITTSRWRLIRQQLAPDSDSDPKGPSQ